MVGKSLFWNKYIVWYLNCPKNSFSQAEPLQNIHAQREGKVGCQNFIGEKNSFSALSGTYVSQVSKSEIKKMILIWRHSA